MSNMTRPYLNVFVASRYQWVRGELNLCSVGFAKCNRTEHGFRIAREQFAGLKVDTTDRAELFRPVSRRNVRDFGRAQEYNGLLFGGPINRIFVDIY